MPSISRSRCANRPCGVGTWSNMRWPILKNTRVNSPGHRMSRTHPMIHLLSLGTGLAVCQLQQTNRRPAGDLGQTPRVRVQSLTSSVPRQWYRPFRLPQPLRAAPSGVLRFAPALRVTRRNRRGESEGRVCLFAIPAPGRPPPIIGSSRRKACCSRSVVRYCRQPLVAKDSRRASLLRPVAPSHL